MNYEQTKNYFRHPEVVEHYLKATNRVGLWTSEERIFTRLFKHGDSILELGCGAGRIAFGLWELGYRTIMGIDYSREMIEEARRVSRLLGYEIYFRPGDATRLEFPDAAFGGAIFGFNGLMQIPGRARRRKALAEINRVLEPGAWFVFTGHDREVHWNTEYWEEQQRLWKKGKQDPELEDFGDMWGDAPFGGKMFIHAASRDEILEDLESAGFTHDVDVLRSDFCREPQRVLDFADDTRFWIVKKPEG